MASQQVPKKKAPPSAAAGSEADLLKQKMEEKGLSAGEREFERCDPKRPDTTR